MKNQNDFVFLHPTKTGGTSVLEALMTKYSVYKNHLPINSGVLCRKKNNKNVFVFSICRNPYDRVLSMFNFFEIAKNMKFDEFLIYLEKMRDNNIFYYPQYKYIQYKDFKVDDVIRLEQMSDDWERVINGVLKISVKELHVNRETQRKKNLTNNEKSTIYNLYKKDFEVLGYKR